MSDVHSLLEERNISAVPVVDASGSPLGVISRTDLLRVGTPRPKERRTTTVLVDLPEKTAGDIMHPGSRLDAVGGHRRPGRDEDGPRLHPPHLRH
ncbi:MAG: CBS domain-containing protein [Polyangiaceae bacterium]|nr:CBS domain-containing protein [Polyangiaceae bacterium]